MYFIHCKVHADFQDYLAKKIIPNKKSFMLTKACWKSKKNTYVEIGKYNLLFEYISLNNYISQMAWPRHTKIDSTEVSTLSEEEAPGLIDSEL